MNLAYRRRVPSSVLTVVLMSVLLVLVAWVPAALGDHIPDTGQIPSNCVEFQANNLGSKSPTANPGVTITLDDWGDLHEIDFSVSGLGAGQYVDISVKSGTNVQEDGPFGNGSHSFDNDLQNAISHIRLCVFVAGTTTTTQPTTTTTDPGTTTTTGGSTTTTAGGSTTTTTGGETTTTTGETTTTTVADEVLGTVITTSTTVAGQSGDTVVASTLPFTGADTGGLGLLGLSLLAAGTLVVTAVRSRDEGPGEI